MVKKQERKRFITQSNAKMSQKTAEKKQNGKMECWNIWNKQKEATDAQMKDECTDGRLNVKGQTKVE